MPMKNPSHPGLHVRHDCLEPLQLSVTKGAEALGVTRQALNNLVNGKSGISPEMAIRLSKAFGGRPAVWLKMQMDYDLAQIEKNAGKIKVRRVLQPA
jgi:addiction module HigA family antidote